MGVEAIIRLPKPRRREWASPSSAALLLQCNLRVAYASDPEFRREVPGSPAARLGTACHQVLEVAGSHALPAPDSAAWRDAFESVWHDAISTEETAAAEHPLESHWPPAERWPGYAIRKVRTRHLAERLASASLTTGQAGGAVELEHERQGFGGRLRGRPDVVRRTKQGSVVEDYKTGVVYEAGTAEVKTGYRLQLLLYSALEQERTGECPRTARLIPLEGEPATIEIKEDDVLEAAQSVLAALDQYNAHVEMGTSPDLLADAKPDHCRFCPFAIRCPGFWSAANQDWVEGGIVAAAGEVTDSEPARFDTFDLIGDVDAGTVAGDRVRLHGLDLNRFGPALHAPAGSSFAATGLRSGTSDELTRCTARTRLLII